MERLPNPMHLRAFEAVARHLNISKAGDELFVSHSAVSQQVKALEEALGVNLIDRTGHKIKLTAAGQEYAETLMSAFGKVRQVSKKIRSYKNSAMIRLGIPNTLGIKCVIPKLSLFYNAYPHIPIQLLICHESNNPPDVDIEICYGEKTEVDATMFLSDDYLVAIKAPSYSDNWRSQANNSLPHVISVSAALRKNDWPQWLAAANLELDLSRAILFRETIQAIEAAENALGVLVTHKIYVNDDLKNNGLLLADPQIVKTDNVFYLKANDSIKNTRAFEEIKTWLVNDVFSK